MEELSRITEMIKAAGAGAAAGVREFKRKGRKRRGGTTLNTPDAPKRRPLSVKAKANIRRAQRERRKKERFAAKPKAV
jgi:hypothetical protein